MTGKVAVAILAGGEGSRIGGAKPLRTLGGERLIDRALRQAYRWSDVVAVSVRDPGQVQPIDALLLTDEAGVDGPLGGLVAGLRFGQDRGREFLLTIAADTPFLPDDLLSRLLSVIDNYDCALASSGGQLHPACGLWRTSALGHVDLYVQSGKRSLKGFAELIGLARVDWPVAARDPFLNINTADDLRRAERLL